VRAEDIVGASFLGLLIRAIAVAVSGSSSTLTPRQRALRRGCGLSLWGIVRTRSAINSHSFPLTWIPLSGRLSGFYSGRLRLPFFPAVQQ
jgi:hypothetical protein